MLDRVNMGDAQGVTHALESLERALDVLHADAQCEVFQRRTQRISVDLEQGRVCVRQGVEEGTAVRLRAPGVVHFGAASGIDGEAAREARTMARALPGTNTPDADLPWAGPGRLLDVEGTSPLPSAAAMEGWLRRAARDARASLDAAVAVETLGSGGGLRTCRMRSIVWGRRLEGTQMWSAVGRRLEQLDPGDWEAPERIEGDPLALPRGGDMALLPAAVGALAPALVAAVPPGAAAGPGWACVDDPEDPDAPSAGPFDDTGFPAERLRLAGGGRVLAAARGPGRRRRHSFREPPVERAANLTFLSSGSWTGHGVLARAARIQAVGPDWWVVLDAARAEKGHPVGPWRERIVRGRPEAWVASCEAVLPPHRRTPEGVFTGTLVFSTHRGLRV